MRKLLPDPGGPVISRPYMRVNVMTAGDSQSEVKQQHTMGVVSPSISSACVQTRTRSRDMVDWDESGPLAAHHGVRGSSDEDATGPGMMSCV